MKIVIVGAGVVGEELCTELSKENHDVILIEQSVEKLEKVINANDITGLVGNGANYSNLLEAGVENTDIFISVTEADEVNIMACIIAKKIGAKYTIARVRNPEYGTNIRFARDELGVSFMINPEYEAAKNIVNKLKFPNANSVDLLFSNRANIIELTIIPESKIDGVFLRDLSSIIKKKVIVCCIKRGEKIIIPDGNFQFKGNDKIYITGTQESVVEFYEEMGYKSKNINSVMIIGGGIISHYLVDKLLKSKKKVKIIDSNDKIVENLSREYGEAIVIKGFGTEQDFLLSEGITDYDAVIALTDNDEENIVISMFAKSINGGKVLTKMSRTALLPIVENQALSPVVPKKIISDIILRVVRSKLNVKSSKMNALHRLFDTEIETIIFEIGEESKAVNIPLKDLKIQDDLLIASILRDDDIIYPGGNDVIKAEDKVMIVSHSGKIEEFDDILVK